MDHVQRSVHQIAQRHEMAADHAVDRRVYLREFEVQLVNLGARLIGFHAGRGFTDSRFILIDLGLKAARNVIAVLCYASAIAGTLLAALLTLRLWP